MIEISIFVFDYTSQICFLDDDLCIDLFFEFLYSHNLLEEIYPGFEEVELVRLWIADYKNQTWGSGLDNPIEVETLEMVDAFFTRHPESSKIDKNLVRLLLAVSYFDANQTDKAKRKVELLVPANFGNILSENFTFANNISFQLIGDSFLNLARLGEFSKASHLMVNIPDGRNKAGIYTYTSAHLSLLGNITLAQQYLDSARLEVAKMDKIQPDAWDFRKNLAHAVALMDKPGKDKAIKLVRNLDNTWRLLSVGLITRAMVHNSEYYLAYSDFSKFTSQDMKLYYINNILYEMNVKQARDGWFDYDRDFNWIYNTIGYSN